MNKPMPAQDVRGLAASLASVADNAKLLCMADHAVYKAKEAGKACLHIHSDEQFHVQKKPVITGL